MTTYADPPLTYACAVCGQTLGVDPLPAPMLVGPCPSCVTPIVTATGKPFGQPIDLDKIPLADRAQIERQMDAMRASRAARSGLLLAGPGAGRQGGPGRSGLS